MSVSSSSACVSVCFIVMLVVPLPFRALVFPVVRNYNFLCFSSDPSSVGVHCEVNILLASLHPVCQRSQWHGSNNNDFWCLLGIPLSVGECDVGKIVLCC